MWCRKIACNFCLYKMFTFVKMFTLINKNVFLTVIIIIHYELPTTANIFLGNRSRHDVWPCIAEIPLKIMIWYNYNIIAEPGWDHFGGKYGKLWDKAPASKANSAPTCCYLFWKILRYLAKNRKPGAGLQSSDSRGVRRAWRWWWTALGTPWWWGLGLSGTDAPQPWTPSPGHSRSAPRMPMAPRPWGGIRWCPPRPDGTCPSTPATQRSKVNTSDIIGVINSIQDSLYCCSVLDSDWSEDDKCQ